MIRWPSTRKIRKEIIKENPEQRLPHEPFATQWVSFLAAKLRATLLQTREQLLHEDNMQNQAALFLDPRFNYSSHWFSAAQGNRSVGYLVELYNRIQSVKQRTNSEDASTSLSAAPSTGDANSQTGIFRRHLGYKENLSFYDRLNGFGQLAMQMNGVVNVQKFWQLNGNLIQ